MWREKGWIVAIRRLVGFVKMENEMFKELQGVKAL